jgi:hypothetical protein
MQLNQITFFKIFVNVLTHIVIIQYSYFFNLIVILKSGSIIYIIQVSFILILIIQLLFFYEYC